MNGSRGNYLDGILAFHVRRNEEGYSGDAERGSIHHGNPVPDIWMNPKLNLIPGRIIFHGA